MKELKNVLVISSRPPFHSAGLGQDIIDALSENGINVDYLTRFKYKNQPDNVISIRNEKPLIIMTLSRLLSFLRLDAIKRIIHRIKPQKSPYIINNNIEIKYPYEDNPAIPIEEVVNAINKDYDLVITLIWQDMITTETLKKIYHKINAPILIYSPDMTPMTGGCFYFNNCTRYTQGCGFCPGLNSPILEDNSRRNYYIKKDNYAQMNVSFLGNTWMNQYVKRSLLFPSDRIFKTEIVIDEVKFRPLNQTSIRRELGLPIDGFIIMLRSTPDIRKGNKDMKRVIDKFVKKLTADEQTNVCILTVGNDYFSSICDISSTYSIFDLGIVDKTLLIKAYNASDLFLCASIDDAGPSMINQSLMCGTPVVSYKIGTTLDVIESGKSGFYSDIRDVNTMAENVHRIFELKLEQKANIREFSREIALMHNSKKAFYESIKNIWSIVRDVNAC